MSAHFGFTPRIEATTTMNDSFRVTAPHDIRDKLWNVLYHSMNDVIDRSPLNKTQFQVQPYPGYTSRQVFVYTTVYLYFIVSPLELEDFMELTLEQHILSMRELIKLPSVKKPAADEHSEERVLPVFAQITQSEFEEAIRIRVAYNTYTRVENSFKSFENIGYRSSVIYERLAEGQNAYRRLQFVDSSKTFISKTVWSQRLSTCQASLSILEQEYEAVKAFNKQIDLKQKEAKTLVEEFKKLADAAEIGQFDIKELLVKYKEVKESLEAIKSVVMFLFSSFDESISINALRSIKSVTPVTETQA